MTGQQETGVDGREREGEGRTESLFQQWEAGKIETTPWREHTVSGANRSHSKPWALPHHTQNWLSIDPVQDTGSAQYIKRYYPSSPIFKVTWESKAYKKDKWQYDAWWQVPLTT